MITYADGRNLQKDKHHYDTPPTGFYGVVAKLNPESSVKTWKHLEFTKQHLKDPQTLRNNILWSDEPQF